MMQIYYSQSSTNIYIANHGTSIISRWGSSTQVEDGGKSINTFIEHSVISHHALDPIHYLYASGDGKLLVAVSANRISWFDATSLLLLYEYIVNNQTVQSAVCCRNNWIVAFSVAGTESFTSEVKILSVAFKDPQNSVVSTRNCGTFTSSRTKLLFENDCLMVCAISDNEIRIYRIVEAPVNTSSPIDAPNENTTLESMFQSMQQPDCTISRDTFQSRLWSALDESPDCFSQCITQVFPNYIHNDWLFEDLKHWNPDDQTISHHHSRWITFQLMASTTDFSLHLWQEFRSANFVDVLHLLMSQGAIGRLQILWRRHFNVQLIQAFSLRPLPMEISAKSVTHWLRQEVLPSYHFHNISTEALSLDIVERAMAVASEGDVDGALQWTSVMCPHLLPPERLWKGSLPESDPLRLVHIQLQQMLHLSKHHDFHVSFEAFQMATVAGLAMAMLDRVQSPSLLLVELSSHVEPFLKISSNTSLSDVLVEYVEEKAGEIPFDEQRCRILLDKIEPLEKRAKATLVILRSIHLPYSHSMLELAVTAARWPSSCQMELQEQFRLMQLEELFRKYGLKYDIRDPRLPARLCRYLCTQVDNADAFDDALTLAQASHQMKRERVVVQFMQNVLMANFTHERCNQLTKALEAVDAPIKWSVAIEVVQFGVMFLESYTHLSQLLAFVTSLASFSCNHRGYWRVINVTFQHALRQISHLQSAYQLPVSLESFCNKSCHEVLLKPILQPWLGALRQPTQSLKRKRSAVTPTMPREMTAEGAASLVRAQQCSSLLGMSNNNFRAFLGKQAAAVGDIDQTLRFTRNTDASTLKHVALALLQYMVMSKQTNSRGFGVARDILVLCVTHESCTTLSEDVVLLKQASLLSTMLELTTDQAEARDEHYQLHLPWRIYDLWYRGVALTLHPSIMPLAINYVMNQYNLADQEQILMSCKELVSHLDDVQAPQLAVSVLLNLTSIPQDALTMLGTQLDQMLSLTLYSHQIDKDLALGYMLSMDQETAFSALNKRLVRENVYNDFARLQQACRHLVSFEELQYPHSLSTFIKCDKESLVRGLWREHFQDTAVLALISELMVSYSISNPSLWLRVLQQMTNLSMFPTIFHILQPLIREFPSVDLHSVFEQTLMWPLHNIDPSLPSSKIGRVLEEIVLLIQQCPFIESLNVTEVVHLLHEAAQKNHHLPILADCAVRCAFGIPRVSIRQKTLCQLCDDNETYVIPIFQYLVDLSPLQQPLEAVFLVDYLITNPGAQEILVQSPLGRKYCDWIAILPQTEALDLVVAFLLDNHRFDDASDVAAHHLQHFPEKQLDASTPLQCYLLQTSSPLLLPYREKLAESTLTLE
ncbi:unnamed protein product [Aphanomyces euteiches]